MTTPTPEHASLEALVRAEADAKLAAVPPLEGAYRTFLDARENFAQRDAANVAALRAAREAAVKAGFTDKALTRAGYPAVPEAAFKAVPARKATPAKSSGSKPVGRPRKATTATKPAPGPTTPAPAATAVPRDE